MKISGVLANGLRRASMGKPLLKTQLRRLQEMRLIVVPDDGSPAMINDEGLKCLDHYGMEKNWRKRDEQTQEKIGYDKAIAKIVAWLRSGAMFAKTDQEIADAIEAGEPKP